MRSDPGAGTGAAPAAAEAGHGLAKQQESSRLEYASELRYDMRDVCDVLQDAQGCDEVDGIVVVPNTPVYV